MSNNRAQVGIGTLIVFIAMVLVAAIAAGVLVDTAGFLQSKAQQTGEDSTAKVTDRVEVVETYGVIRHLEPDDSSTTNDVDGEYYVEIDNGETNTETTTEFYGVHELNFVMMRSAGSGNIQLDKVVLMWQGPDGAEEFTLSDSSYFVTINDVTGASDSVLDEQSDRARVELTLDPGDENDDSNPDTALEALEGGEEVTVKFTTVSGATVRKTISMPSTYTSQDGAVVDL
jgi:flagellin-like protein